MSEKKVVRKVVKVIDKEDLKNTNIRNEISSYEAVKKKQEEARLAAKRAKELAEEAERARKEAAEREQREREERERRRREEEARKKKLEEERIRRQQEEERKRLAEIAAKKEKRKKDEEIRKKKAEAKKQRRQNEKKAKNGLPVWRKVLFGLKVFFISGFIIGLSGTAVIGLVLFSWCQDLPEIDITELGRSAQTSYIYDINGELLTTYSGVENREWVEIEDMPKQLVDAFVCIEDKRFYEHGPIDYKRFIKAVLGQLIGNDDAGGSTITQQLVKNVYLTNEVTYKRKMREIVLASRLEKEMTKDEILEAYLNIIYFGSSNYGVAAAAKDYFGKELDELTSREIAMLAGIPKNPNGYNPRRNTYVKKDMSKTNKRTDDVLWVMHNEGVISDIEYELAQNENVEIKEGSSFFEMYDCAHAIEYTMQQVVADMLEAEGLPNTSENRIAMDNKLRAGGYSIYTSIDPSVQNAVQDALENGAYPNVLKKDENGKLVPIVNDDGSYEKPQAAAVVIDHTNGHIIAMVGSRDKPNSMKTLNRAVNSNMPVASTIKPLSIYAPAINNGLYPGSVEYNFSTYINGWDNKGSYPGGTSPESVVTLREATEQSYNIAAARFLVDDVGYEQAEDYLVALGVDKESIQKNGSGLALGTSGIDMLELTAAYQALANGGWYYEPKGYLWVVDNKGNKVLDSSDYQDKRQVFSYDTAWLITDVLKSTVSTGSGGKAMISGIETAGKTGTHEDRCALFSGYTGDYVSSLWIGSDAFSALSDASGGRIAAPIWQAYMNTIYKEKEGLKAKIYDSTPNTIHKYTLCKVSGMLAGDDCTETYEDYSSREIGECNLHVEVGFCKYSNMLAGPLCDEKDIVMKKVLFVPADSKLATVDEEVIKKHFPDAVVENPENMCMSHVNGNTILTEAQIGYSKSLQRRIEQLVTNTLLEQQYIDLLNADHASLANMVARAEEALYNGAQESPNFYNEYFAEYNRVKTDINNVQAIINNIQAQQTPVAPIQ